MSEITIPSPSVDVLRWPDGPFATLREGLAGDGGDYAVVGTDDPGIVTIVRFTEAAEAITPDSVESARQSPEWLSHRKRQMLDDAPEAIGTPLAAAWKRLAPIIDADPSRLSATNYARRQSDLDVLASALSAAETAISTAPDIGAAEAAGAAVTAPVYQGPEVVA